MQNQGSVSTAPAQPSPTGMAASPPLPKTLSTGQIFGIGIAVVLMVELIGGSILVFKPELFRFGTSSTALLPHPTVSNSSEPSTPAPLPTPTPLSTGPGKHACDILGICNIYDDPVSKGCPVTFADPNCLHQCGDSSKRCPVKKP